MIIKNEQRITKKTAAEILKMAEAANDRRRTRTITQDEVGHLINRLRKHRRNPEVRTIRVYSADGFVPNSYKYRADITRLTAERTDGGWSVFAEVVGAQRPRGQGSQVTINNRAES